MTLYGSPRDPDAEPPPPADRDWAAPEPSAAPTAADAVRPLGAGDTDPGGSGLRFDDLDPALPETAGPTAPGSAAPGPTASRRSLLPWAAASGIRQRALIGAAAAAVLVIALTAGMVGGRLDRTAASWLHGPAPTGAPSSPAVVSD
ncbi:MAG: hypothetical protein ACM30G_00540, partial [Micromonosporaceae bacterium]